MTADKAIRLVWDYMLLHQKLKNADVIFVLGSRDTRVAEYAARLYLDGWAPALLFSGSGSIHNHKPGINTVLERKTGLVFVTKLAGKKSADTVNALAQRFASVPGRFKHTLTLDRGSENGDALAIRATTGLDVYHEHANSAWERGANENVNGLIRDYFPKKTDFTLVSHVEIAAVEYALNTRLRKRLGWRTPLEAWSGALAP